MSKRKVEPRRKLVVVGDGGCGKTCLLQVFSGKPFDDRYVPTVFQNFCSEIEVNGKLHELTLWDTAGQEEFDRLRPLSYDKVNIILICFSYDSPASLENVSSKWIPELHQLCAGVPYLLVGCKLDVKNDSAFVQELEEKGGKLVTREEAEAVAKTVGASRFIECSAKGGIGIKDVFTAAVESSIEPKKGKGCLLM